jgi:hypothetical protein
VVGALAGDGHSGTVSYAGKHKLSDAARLPAGDVHS